MLLGIFSKKKFDQFQSAVERNSALMRKVLRVLAETGAEPRDLSEIDNEWKKHPPRQTRSINIIREHLEKFHLSGGALLEIGGRKNPIGEAFREFDYTALDLSDTGNNVVVGDITNCPQIPDNSYDLIVSLDVFEHINAPWLAANEIKRILKPNGITYHTTLFSWRYHPCPIDYWRFTPKALEFIFEGLEHLHASFDYSERRRNILGQNKNRMKPDALGGWRENVRVHYVGKKPETSR